jgi:hypothetical protein
VGFCRSPELEIEIEKIAPFVHGPPRFVGLGGLKLYAFVTCG